MDEKEWSKGINPVENFRNSGADYLPESEVWGVEPCRVFYKNGAKSHVINTSSVVVACGGMERPVPFPGWTLPGVLGAGGADILLRYGGRPVAGNDPVVLVVGWLNIQQPFLPVSLQDYCDVHGA